MNDNTRIRIAVPAHLYESVKKQLTLNEAAAKFKKGDKVKVTIPTSNMANKVGTITKVELDKNLPYEVSDSKGPAGNFKASQLKLAEGINEAKQNFGAGFTAVKEKKTTDGSKPKVEGMKSSKAPKMEGEKTEKTVEERLDLLEKLVKAMSKGKSAKDEGIENEIGYEKGNQKPDGEDDVNLADNPTNDKKDK